MSDEAKKIVDAAKNRDGAAFKASFEAGVSQKIGDALQTQRQEVAKNVFGNIRVPANEAKLTTKQRNALPDSEFAVPNRGDDESDDAYPIPDESHARNALARVSAHGTSAEKAKVRAAVAKKFPNIKQGE